MPSHDQVTTRSCYFDELSPQKPPYGRQSSKNSKGKLKPRATLSRPWEVIVIGENHTQRLGQRFSNKNAILFHILIHPHQGYSNPPVLPAPKLRISSHWHCPSPFRSLARSRPSGLTRWLAQGLARDEFPVSGCDDSDLTDARDNDIFAPSTAVRFVQKALLSSIMTALHCHSFVIVFHGQVRIDYCRCC